MSGPLYEAIVDGRPAFLHAEEILNKVDGRKGKSIVVFDGVKKLVFRMKKEVRKWMVNNEK